MRALIPKLAHFLDLPEASGLALSANSYLYIRVGKARRPEIKDYVSLFITVIIKFYVISQFLFFCRFLRAINTRLANERRARPTIFLSPHLAHFFLKSCFNEFLVTQFKKWEREEAEEEGSSLMRSSGLRSVNHTSWWHWGIVLSCLVWQATLWLKVSISITNCKSWSDLSKNK